MPVFLVNAWTWFTNNKWAQYLALGVLLFLGLKRWEHNVEKGVRRQEREAAGRRSAEAERDMISTITENSNEYVRASERVRNHNVAEQLPDGGGVKLPEAHYRD